MSEPDDKPSTVEIERFKLEVSRQHLQYLKFIRTRGFHVDDAEISRLESELAQEEANFNELLSSLNRRSGDGNNRGEWKRL